jgi:hypothetical protein
MDVAERLAVLHAIEARRVQWSAGADARAASVR